MSTIKKEEGTVTVAETNLTPLYALLCCSIWLSLFEVLTKYHQFVKCVVVLPWLSAHLVHDQAMDDDISSLFIVDICRCCKPKARTLGIIQRQAHLTSDAVVEVRAIHRAVGSLVRSNVLQAFDKGKIKGEVLV